MAKDIARGGKYEDGSTNEEAKDYVKKYHIFGLEAYIHSGVALHLSGEVTIDMEWDVSQTGLVFISKEESKTRAKARKLAQGLLEEWNDYLSGNIYGYRIEKPNGEESGGCWGFYDDYNTSGLIESAEDEIKTYMEEDKKLEKIAKQSQA